MKYSKFIFTPEGLAAVASGRYKNTDRRNTFGPIFATLIDSALLDASDGIGSRSDVTAALLEGANGYTPKSYKDDKGRKNDISGYILYAGKAGLIENV